MSNSDCKNIDKPERQLLLLLLLKYQNLLITTF